VLMEDIAPEGAPLLTGCGHASAQRTSTLDLQPSCCCYVSGNCGQPSAARPSSHAHVTCTLVNQEHSCVGTSRVEAAGH
jgi:hypothetical protein